MTIYPTIVVFLSMLTAVLCQYKPAEILTVKQSLCTTNYYNWPRCVDTPKGYQCLCGAGFYWNTKICISDAVDSRLEFPERKSSSDEKKAFAYALLLNKPFPLLKQFTLSLYVKPTILESSARQCVFSYKYRYGGREYIFALFVGVKTELVIHNITTEVVNSDIRTGHWTQLVVTWTSSTGEVAVYFNKTRAELLGGIVLMAQGQHIESNGHMVLGQYSPDAHNNFNLSMSYIGSLAHFNIWKNEFSKEQLDILQSDCSFTHCGNGVEWVDLRAGTRGTARLRWPSGIVDSQQCFSSEEALETCDKYCSFIIGVQCKQEIRESVQWVRTKAAPENASVAVVKEPCPGFHSVDNETDIPMANRSCKSNAEKVGVWGEPQMDNCLSQFFLTFSRKVKSYETNAGESFDKIYVQTLLTLLESKIRLWNFVNPVDISVTISSLFKLIQLQKAAIEKLLSTVLEAPIDYTEQAQTPELAYNDTISLLNLHLAILDQLMESRHDQGWNKTLPLGQEADELLQLVKQFIYVVSLSLEYHKLTGAAVDPLYRKSTRNIALKVQVVRKNTFFGVVFPDPGDRNALDIQDVPAVISYNHKKVNVDNSGAYADDLCVSAIRLNTFSKLLYDTRYLREDSINSPVVSIQLYQLTNRTLVSPNITSVKMVLLYSNAQNISNPECVSIVHGKSPVNRIWSRERSTCQLLSNDTISVTCLCDGHHFYAATTDMYNENWRIAPEDPELMSAPSYVGCCLSLLLCICTLSMLAYVGTSSRTAVMHKHYAVAVICNTSVFMVGITQTSNEILCRSFAVLFHYFFLTVFSWLMNEGFNVYISITYTAHNQNTQDNSGHWRYYIIGWGVPAILVSAIIGASFDNYFSEDMCFVKWEQIWLFIGPPLALICVTLLVMIFAAKENNEVSYTKNESANAMTEYQANAIWTQLILVTSTWSIALLSLKFESIVFKWVFFIFNTAQGAFLFVFFFLLNEEVRSVFKTKEIRQQLGWSPSSSTNEDEAQSTMPLTRTGGTPAREDQANTNVQHIQPDELDTLTETSV